MRTHRVLGRDVKVVDVEPGQRKPGSPDLNDSGERQWRDNERQWRKAVKGQ